MRLARFQANGVHGRYKFDISFNEDITFLVGINGSGKTTALVLMQALLTLDLYTLLSIEFTNMQVTILGEAELSSISVVANGKILTFEVNGFPIEYLVAKLDDEKHSLYSATDRIEGYVEDQRVELVQMISRQFPRFSKSNRPLFLGLERRASRYEIESLHYDEDMARRSFSSGRPIAGRGLQGRSLQDGLGRCQFLVERAYRRYRKVSDGVGGRLTNIIVDSMFDYIEFDERSLADEGKAAVEFHSLLARRKEIEALAVSVGGGRTAEAQINKFFSKIEGVLSRVEVDGAFHIEWLMNKSQMLRMHKLLAEMDRQKKQAERSYEPIKNFIHSVNGFFRDSRKSVSVDSLGKLKVAQDGAEIALQSLSSGERQLLILLAHAWFARNDNGVVIVDEPEISLHLRWQERLVEEISKGSGSQMIFATHSPEIVGYGKDKCVLVG